MDKFIWLSQIEEELNIKEKLFTEQLMYGNLESVKVNRALIGLIKDLKRKCVEMSIQVSEDDIDIILE